MYRYWRIYCQTDSQYEYTWASSAPTVCPVDGGHTVDSSDVTLISKNNNYMDATSDPTVNDDSTTGNFEVGSRWMNTTSGNEFTCTENTPGAAIWKKLTQIGVNETDQQLATSTVDSSTTSTDYVDLDSMTLTTSNSGSNTYFIACNAFVTQDFNVSYTGSICINIDGVGVAVSERSFGLKSSDGPTAVSLEHLAANIASGKIIKVMWKTNGGTLNAHARSLSIYSVK